MNQEDSPKKIIRMKEIMRLFFKYEVDVLPVVDKKDKFKGFVDKNLVLQDATDSTFIEKPFSKVIHKYLSYPEEEGFLRLVSKLSEETGLPVIDNKGNYLFMWFKKDLLNHYYHYPKQASEEKSDDDLFKEILKILPFNIVLTDDLNRVIFTSDSFLEEFEFDEGIILNQELNKLFPAVNKILTKASLYPKVHKIQYRHIDWFYIILNYLSFHIYVFSVSREKVEHISKEGALPVEKLEITVKDKDPETPVKETAEENRSLPDIIEDKESIIIRNALKENDWNVSKAAKILDIPRQTLQYKISKYKII